MNTLDIKAYGYPLIDTYSINTDLALQRSKVVSGWERQRRTYLHNASLINLRWKLRVKKAKQLNDWLQALPVGAFFLCPLLTGNDADASCVISDVAIRRTTDIRTDRVYGTDEFVVSFSAETQSQTDYQALSTAARGQPPTTYPTEFPLPLMAGFTSTQSGRNVSTYTLTYVMNTAMLGDWLAFAGFLGTAWFRHPMVSITVPCGIELLRYISEPVQTLVAPDRWEVSITAETMPASTLLELILPPPSGDCPYDGASSYDDPAEVYDCTGVTPPQGAFTMPSSQVVISASAVGLSPLTASGSILFKVDGTIVSTPASVPAWATWHTAPQTLPNPVVAFNEVVEVSRNGTDWFFSTPVSGGSWLSLQSQDLWARLTKTSTYDETASLAFGAEFREDPLVVPAVPNTAAVRIDLTLDVTDPTGVVDGAVFNDGYNYTFDPGDTVESVSAGVTFYNDGRVVGQSGNQPLGLWFDPQQTNAGQGLWIELTGTGTGTGQPSGKTFPPTGVRLSLAVTNWFTAIAGSTGGGSYAQVSWIGTYAIYNSQVGGTLLGSGSINLESEVSQ